MIDWKPVELTDRSWMDPLIKASDFRGCEYSFGTIFLWRNIFKTKAARSKDRLLVRIEKEKGFSYLFPPGTGDLKEALELLENDSISKGVSFFMHSVNEQARAELEAIYPGRYLFAPIRDSFDYIYDAESLANLKGKKLHGKRNHINRFLADFEGRWNYEPIDKQNISECIDMNKVWSIKNNCDLDKSKKLEQLSVKEAFENYFDLELLGGLLRVDGRVIAFSIGQPLNSDTMLVHIEKAFSEYRGAYPMINRQFILANAKGFSYINREDDTGSEGLRKSKLSYYPAFLETKYKLCKSSELTKAERERFEAGKSLYSERISV